MKPTKANLECADVILERNRLDPRAWQSLRRDIAIAITMAEKQKPKRRAEGEKGEGND